MRILVTMGGTREYLDNVRFITNMSTGHTGRVLAARFAAAGHLITCLCAEGAERPGGKKIKIVGFTGFADLNAKIKTTLADTAFDAIVHLAAVSDYSPLSIEAGGERYRPGREGKIPSSAPRMILTLKKNFKILDRIKSYARASGYARSPLVIAFKLTSGARRPGILKAVKALAAADIVVHNDTDEIKDGHPFHIYKNGAKIRDCRGAGALAGILLATLKGDTCF